MDRRRFLKTGTATAAASALLPGLVAGRSARSAPSERMGVGILGMGNRGNYHRRNLQRTGDVQIRAVCDPNAKEAREARDKVNEAYANQSGQSSRRRMGLPYWTRSLSHSASVEARPRCLHPAFSFQGSSCSAST